MAKDDLHPTYMLWNSNVTEKNYGSKEQYYEHILEQYKLAIEMADRVSVRRNLANTFFLSLHTLIISAIGFSYEKGPGISNPWLNVIPLAILLLLCFIWWRMIYSYKQLNSAKFKVIGDLEKVLPSSPFVGAEWKLLSEGRDKRNYLLITTIETWIPAIFAILYVIGAVAIGISF